MLDRTNSPLTSLPDRIEIPVAQRIELPGGIPLISIRSGTQELVKIEFVFAAGSARADRVLTATACNDLLDEGTLTHSAAEVAEILDFYGAFLQSECGTEWASVSLFSLNKFVGETLPVLEGILTSPAFPESEIGLYALQGKQRLQVALSKVDVLARRQLLSSLYGSDTAVGRMSVPGDYDLINRQSLIDFHREHYLNGLRAVFISGLPDQALIDSICDLVQRNGFKNQFNGITGFSIPGAEERFIEKDDAIQSAIRVGRRLFGREHPDYIPFSVLNTILGGYFGSRLMSNIREDKGYTYGIGSGVVPQCGDGYFFISTEVGAAVRESAVLEIHAELARLRETLVPAEELGLVINYMTGAFQRSLDGPFALADRYKTIELNNLNYSYLTGYLSFLRSVSAEQILNLANTYLKDDALTCVIAGK
jgi:zinc protease